MIYEDSQIIISSIFRKWALEIFKVHIHIATEIVKDLFEIKNQHYDFRGDIRLQCKNVVTALYDTEQKKIRFFEAQTFLAKNYRPVCLLSCILKIFERIIQNQLQT